MARHVRLGTWEGDWVARDRRGWCLVEVRYRREGRAVAFLSREKCRRLGRAAEWLASRTGKPVRVVLLEVRGDAGAWLRYPRLLRRGLGWFPEWFGIRLTAYPLDSLIG